MSDDATLGRLCAKTSNYSFAYLAGRYTLLSFRNHRSLTEVQRDSTSCPGSHSEKMTEA